MTYESGYYIQPGKPQKKKFMNYWWVNHKQTVRQEIEGGYLWSPKREKNGSRSQFYEFMREVRPGDLVVSFADTITLLTLASISRIFQSNRRRLPKKHSSRLPT